MSSESVDEECEERLDWEKELLTDQRWGQLRKWFPETYGPSDNKRIFDEHVRLKKLWERAQPVTKQAEDVLRSIIALEICNWNLEASIMSLCEAIGTKTSPRLKIGHNYSITDERWKKVWAYYLALKKWLPNRDFTGYDALLKLCDPDAAIQKRILKMLGNNTELKQLYVERFCLNLEYWLAGFFPEKSPQMKAYQAAVTKLENEISELDPESEMLEWMRLDGKRGWIEICHHKAFRRFDIQISSIGSGKWRKTTPLRGTDGQERAETLEKYLFAIETWINGAETAQNAPDKGIFQSIHKLLGEKDDTKIFLASLLVSLLRPQQLAAKRRAEKRTRIHKP